MLRFKGQLLTAYEIKKQKLNFNSFQKIAQIKNNQCIRCGNKKLIQNSYKLICNNCAEFGLTSSDDFFYYLPRNSEKIKNHYCDLNFLTPLQKKGQNFIEQNLGKNPLLIWAVCGSGKTEIILKSIIQVINKGKIVAVAIPRINLLYELAERIQNYLPNAKIVIINGQESRYQNGEIYFVTTNQLLRFYNFFELIIIDEADSYPFCSDDKYDFAAQKALKIDSKKIIYMSATPTTQILNKNLQIFELYERYHQNPLPIPQKKFIYHQNLNYWVIWQIKNIIKKGIWIIYVSTFQKLHNLSKKLKIPHFIITAQTKNNYNKINDFKAGKVKIIIATTILERGITVKNLNVLILDSDHIIFNKNTLIQIAGRVGRYADAPNGQVIFGYMTKTLAQKKAIKEIKKLNYLKEHHAMCTLPK